MKKIILLLLITFSFSQEHFSAKDITITINNSMQSIDISNYLTLESGFYIVEPIFLDSFSGTIEDFSVSFQWDTSPFYSEFGVQRNYDFYTSIVDMAVYDDATISAQNSILNIMWSDDYLSETISFNLVLRVSGLFDESSSL